MASDWSRYWRSPELPLEAMHAHFERHVYHRHAHETYSFGVTEAGAQAFTCRGAAHPSAAGMVMAFNPDDPHDGHAATELGFTYRMLHIGPEPVVDTLADLAGRHAARPLFAKPVVADAHLAARLRTLHAALLGDGAATALRRDELLAAALAAIVRRAAARPVAPAPPRGVTAVARRARRLIDDAYLTDLPAEALARAAGASRFAVYRAFRTAYGMAPSDYRRLLRLRAARRLIDRGLPLGEVAARAGFADQSHLTRWFLRAFGLTPGAYRAAAGR